MKATSWDDAKARRPLRGAAKEAYAAERKRMGVGYLVLKARSEAGMTQATLARAVGTSQSTVARWESGAQVPSVTSMVKIAQATGFELALGLHRPDERPGKLAAVEFLGTKRRRRSGAA
jgi:transcriptional regulator with XRE-family HTH domain